jgi:hypothetical protein
LVKVIKLDDAYVEKMFKPVEVKCGKEQWIIFKIKQGIY